MTHEQESLGQAITKSLGDKMDSCEISAADLAGFGFTFPSLEFADWLTAHGLRMMWQSRKAVIVVRQQ